MNILVNTDKNIEGSERLRNFITDLLTSSLSRFADHITRIEIHLKDENSGAKGGEDKKCTMEVRLEKLQPMAVNHTALNLDQAIHGALDKLERMLDSTLGKKFDPKR
jgi:ribosomal subunit interface protein